MVFKIITFLFIFLLSAGVYSQNRIPVLIDINTVSIQPKKSYNIYYEIKIKNRETILFYRTGEVTSKTENARFIDTIVISNSDKFEFEIQYGKNMLGFKDGFKLAGEIYKFEISGKEDSVNIYNHFIINDEILKLEFIYVRKYYDGSEFVYLIPDWDFKKGSLPRYKIVNNTPGKKFYGSGGGNLFWSELFTYKKREWIKDYFSLICGSNGKNLPISYGDTGRAELPGYIPNNLDKKNPEFFPPRGKYKFRTLFTDMEYNPIRDPESNISKGIVSLYQVSTEFEIK